MPEQTSLEFYQQQVWPMLPASLADDLAQRYPNLRLQPEAGFSPLSQQRLLMVVGFTGTGKSTMLNALAGLREQGQIDYRDDIPSRREIADLVLLPAAQVWSGQPITPVKDRADRFRLTRIFSQHIEPGGFSAVYRWLYYRDDLHLPLVSEGVRGQQEIAHVLQHSPNWRIFELWVDPITRLQRLSHRADAFDSVRDAAIDWSFLSDADAQLAQRLLEQGKISHKALLTVQAESANYGGQAFDPHNQTARYRFLRIDTLSPQLAAQQLADFMAGDERS